MSSHYLLDTNIISYLTNPNSPYRESVKKHLIALTDNDVISVSIITLYELSYGLYSYKSTPESIALFKQGIHFIEQYLEVLPLDIQEVDIFGKLKAKYKDVTGIQNKANKKNDLDFLIVATAINHNATLISNDMIFDKLFEIEPRIKYENWIN